MCQCYGNEASGGYVYAQVTSNLNVRLSTFAEFEIFLYTAVQCAIVLNIPPADERIHDRGKSNSRRKCSAKKAKHSHDGCNTNISISSSNDGAEGIVDLQQPLHVPANSVARALVGKCAASENYAATRRFEEHKKKETSFPIELLRKYATKIGVSSVGSEAQISNRINAHIEKLARADDREMRRKYNI